MIYMLIVSAKSGGGREIENNDSSKVKEMPFILYLFLRTENNNSDSKQPYNFWVDCLKFVTQSTL